MTDQTNNSSETSGDIETIDAMIASLDDENAKLAATVEDAQAEVAEGTKQYVDRMDADAVKLRELQDQADAEEKAGGTDAAREAVEQA